MNVHFVMTLSLYDYFIRLKLTQNNVIKDAFNAGFRLHARTISDTINISKEHTIYTFNTIKNTYVKDSFTSNVPFKNSIDI